MTLIVAIEGIDFVVLAADSQGRREIYGTRVDSKSEEKLMPLTKYSCVLISGNGEIGTQLIEEFKSQVKNIDSLDITKVVKKFSKFCKKEITHISDSVSPSDEAFPEITYIVAGLDKKRNGRYIPKINILRSTSLFCPGRIKYKAADGKPMIAYYILDKEYRMNQSQNDLCFLIGKVMSETIRIDGDVGGTVKIAVIDKKGLRIIPEHVVNDFMNFDKEEYTIKKEKEELEKIIKE